MGDKPEKSLYFWPLASFRNVKALLFLAVFSMAIVSPAAVSTAADNETCYGCHADPEKIEKTEKARIDPVTGEITVVPLLIDRELFEKTAHGGEDFSCYDCHTEFEDMDDEELEENGHEPNLKPVDCITFCHDDPAEEFLKSTHVKLMREKNKDVPTCKDCHNGLTYFFGPSGEKAPMYVPRGTDPLHRKLTIEACASCHQDYFASYRNNAHGQVTALGYTSTDVPVCFDCHGKHEILNSSEPESKVGEANIIETCGSCHAEAHASFVKHIEHPQIKNLAFYKSMFIALKSARQDPGSLKKIIKDPQVVLCIVFVAYIGILTMTFAKFGLHALLGWLSTIRDELRRKEGSDEEHH
ncbi:MAG: hypothetical protein MRJ65_16820 [Candidatus Brocadiaceae bacterium]|nr:hypothetical protein [Candidatus Brocadiaceae bacterium]